VCTYSGYRYWITFIDDYSRFRAVAFLKAKSEALVAFKTFKAWAENVLELKIKSLQDDKGGEYMSAESLKFTDECGIERRHTTRNRPQQNGVAESANLIISLLCLWKLNFLLHSGGSVLVLWSMSGIVSLLLPCHI
jgi:transposase InsO family protein